MASQAVGAHFTNDSSSNYRESRQQLRLGNTVYDITHQALVMGILNRTPDSFFDHGAYFQLDAFLDRAEQLVMEGADILDVGGVKAGAGDEVSLQEELDRVVPAIEALKSRFDLPISVDTWRSEVLLEACRAGAVVGNDISGFADPSYLAVAAASGASVVATHIRLAPRVPDPNPVYENVVKEVSTFLLERARWAEAAGISADRIMVDAGLDLGKTTRHSLVLLRDSSVLAALGYPLFLSVSNKDFLGEVLNLRVHERRDPTLSAVAWGVARGARVVRVHDVLGAKRVCTVLSAILETQAIRPGLDGQISLSPTSNSSSSSRSSWNAPLEDESISKAKLKLANSDGSDTSEVLAPRPREAR